MNIFDNYTGLYFYSSIFQGNMALLAFAAVFVVFKLQILANNQQAKGNEIISYALEYFSPDCGRIPEDIKTALQNINDFMGWVQIKLSDADYKPHYRKTLETFSKRPNLKVLLDEHKLIVSQQSLLLRKMRLPFLSILIVVIASLLLLPFASAIHSNQMYELFLFIAIIVANIIALAINAYFIFAVLRNG